MGWQAPWLEGGLCTVHGPALAGFHCQLLILRQQQLGPWLDQKRSISSQLLQLQAQRQGRYGGRVT